MIKPSLKPAALALHATVLLLLAGCGSGGGNEPDPDIGTANPSGEESSENSSSSPDSESVSVSEPNWGVYGPFDDLAASAVIEYNGADKPASLDSTTAGVFFDSILFGPLAGQTISWEIASGEARRSLLDSRYSVYHYDYLLTDASFSHASTQVIRCVEGGKLTETIKSPETNTQGVRLITVVYDNCVDFQSTINGTVSIAVRTNESDRSTETVYGFDNLSFKGRDHDLTLHGAELRAVEAEGTYCEGKQELTSTLLLIDGISTEQILMDTLQVEGADPAVFECSSYAQISRSNVRSVNGRIMMSSLGAVDVSTVVPLARQVQTIYSTVLSEEPDNKDPWGTIELTGAESSAATFSYINTGVDSDHRLPADSSTLVEVNVDPVGNFREQSLQLTVSSFLSGALTALHDEDRDGMLDGWEVYYGLNPNNPSDAAIDSDEDGRSNLYEFETRTNPRVRRYEIPLLIDESIDMRVVRSLDADGIPVFEAQVTLGIDSALAQPANRVVELAIEGDAIWIEGSLPDGCEVLDPELKSVQCVFEKPDWFGNEADRPDIEAFLPIWAKSDGQINVMASAIPTDIEHTPADNYTSVLHEVLETPPVDLQLVADAAGVGTANNRQVLRAIISQPEIAAQASVDVTINVPAGVLIDSAELLELGQRQSLVARCLIQGNVTCQYDAMRAGDQLELVLEYRVVATGSHTLHWEVGSDVVELDERDNTASSTLTQVDDIATLQALIDAAVDDDVVRLPGGTYVGMLLGRGKRLEVIGSEGAVPTTLMSLDPEVTLLRAFGDYTVWRNLQLRTTGGYLIENAGNNSTLADSDIAPVKGTAHSVSGLIENQEGYRLEGNRISGFGLNGSGSCHSLIHVVPGSDIYSAGTYFRHNVFDNNHCQDLIYIGDEFGFSFDYGQPVYVSNNTFVNNPNLFQVGGSFYPGDVEFRNNIIIG